MKLPTPVVYLPLVLATALFASSAGNARAQGAKMTVGQTGTNPGTALFFIAEKENLFAKHGLNVNIIKSNTAAAVQAMLGGSMQMTTGSGAAAFTTATLEGAPPFVLVSSWVNVFPYKVMAQKEYYKSRGPQGKDRSYRRPVWDHPRHRVEIRPHQIETGSRKGCQACSNCQS